MRLHGWADDVACHGQGRAAGLGASPSRKADFRNAVVPETFWLDPVTRSSRRRRTDMTGTHVPLLRSDLYEIAYLAGGPRRVVETAVVALVENGRLRVDRVTGWLHVVDPHRRHPVEAAVLDAVGPRGRSFGGLAWRARSDPRLATVADGLDRNGLLTRRGGVDARERSFWTLSGLT